jgi:hypothetical protein
MNMCVVTSACVQVAAPACRRTLWSCVLVPETKRMSVSQSVIVIVIVCADKVSVVVIVCDIVIIVISGRHSV